MKREVWGYWQCPYCKTVVHGKFRSCRNCGSAIPNNIKYLPPNHPLVQEALRNHPELDEDGDETDNIIDEKGNTVELVDTNEINDETNWICRYCGYQNFDNQEYCQGCGSPKSEEDYFDYHGGKRFKQKKNQYVSSDDNSDSQHSDGMSPCNRLSPITDSLKKSTPKRESSDYTSSSPKSESPQKTVNTDTSKEKENNTYKESSLREETERRNNLTKIKKGFTFNSANFDLLKKAGLTIGAILGVIFLIWLFFPITREAIITGFSWQRSIDVEEYTLCHENGWSVPSGAKITSKKQEIHHYDRVLDHYETKTRQVAYQEFDGYDTEYIDKGNGQFQMVQTPRYVTKYKTETYQEPVYKNVPVYQTKYYYDIGKWKSVDSLTTSGRDRNPYWHETDLPTNVNNPDYGDRKQGSKSEKYYAIIRDYKDNTQKTSYDYSDWMKLEVGDTITYKTFRFSDKPLN